MPIYCPSTLDDRYPRIDLSPQRRKEKTFRGAVAPCSAIRARRQPLLMLFEDACIGPMRVRASCLDVVISALGDLPIFIVITTRPRIHLAVGRPSHCSSITLRAIKSAQSALLASEVALDQKLPPALLDRIVTQTDGIPLFVEELTKTVSENVAQSDCVVTALTVPATLQASLMARLDRLPAAKRVAQIGAGDRATSFPMRCSLPSRGCRTRN